MSPKGRISDIEVLRGIAVIFVIVCHARDRLFPWKIVAWDVVVQNYFNFWTGVDLFFAISGFVIARTLLPGLRQTKDTAGFLHVALVFWVRRCWRLLPSAWLWLVIILACSVLFRRSGLFGLFHANFEATIGGMLSLANIRLGIYFEQYVLSPSSHYWSLSLEEQFYLFLPVLAFLFRRHLTAALLVLTAVIFALPQTTLVMAFRLHAVLLGVLLAIFSDQPAYGLFEPVFLRRRPWASALFVTSLLGLIAALAVLGQTIVSHSVDVAALLCAILVLTASYDRHYICPNPVLRRVLVWVGARSYGLYLIHVPAFLLAREIWFQLDPPGTIPGPEHALRFGCTGVALLLALTELNFRFVERPLRQHGVAVAARLAARPLALPVEADPLPVPRHDVPVEGELPAET